MVENAFNPGRGLRVVCQNEELLQGIFAIRHPRWLTGSGWACHGSMPTTGAGQAAGKTVPYPPRTEEL